MTNKDLDKLVYNLSLNFCFESNVYIFQTMTPLGRMIIAASEEHLYLSEFVSCPTIEQEFRTISSILKCQYLQEKTDLISATIKQLREYFYGYRKYFELPINMIGTNFQKSVWKSLMKIPFGQTVSYFDVANNLGKSGAGISVGQALRKNKLAIFVPCHRVIGKNRNLVGYNAGLWRKQNLIQRESLFEFKDSSK